MGIVLGGGGKMKNEDFFVFEKFLGFYIRYGNLSIYSD